MNNEIKKLQEMIDNSNYIVFLGGAGTSTDCGLPDFRGTNGLYSDNERKKYKWSPEIMLSHNFYVEHPEEFFEFYRDKMIFDYAEPNEFHKKLAKLEEIGKLKCIVTQNIDGLHQKGGSKNVIELHGASAHNYCRKCGKDYSEQYMKETTGVPRCECGGIIKPDVVLYGEQLKQAKINEAVEHISKADMLIVAGTSLTVYPAAGLVDYFSGDYLVVINKQSTPRDNYADIVLKDSITDVFNQLTI